MCSQLPTDQLNLGGHGWGCDFQASTMPLVNEDRG